MLRTTVGVSFLLVLGAAAACSSKTTESKDGAGGNSAIAGGSTNAAGTTGTTGGAYPSNGGRTSAGGTTSSGGGVAGACTDETITCVDDVHAMGCNFDTGVVDTFSCVDEYAGIGFVATGCTKDPTGDSCNVTGVADTACQKGAQAYGHCAGTMSDQDLFNIYVNCFQDFMDAHTIVPCFADYVSPAMMSANDCLKAEDACLPGGTGTGGTGGGTSGGTGGGASGGTGGGASGGTGGLGAGGTP